MNRGSSIFFSIFATSKKSSMKKNLIISVLMPVLVVLSYIFAVGFQVEYRGLLTLILLVGLMSLAIRRSRVTYQLMKDKSQKIQAESFALMYIVEIALPYIVLPIFTFGGLYPYSTIIVFLSLPVAIACAKTMKNAVKGGPAMIADLNDRTANLLTIFSLLFSIAFIVSRF